MNKDFFDLAFAQAKEAFKNNEVPIGAVIVKNGDVIAAACNKKEKMHSSIAHAEILAIQEATKVINNWRLEGCEMYVTLDPCPMCASAIKQSRISTVYSALSNSDKNNSQIIEQIFMKDKINPPVKFETNLNKEKSQFLLNVFFEKQRNN